MGLVIVLARDSEAEHQRLLPGSSWPAEKVQLYVCRLLSGAFHLEGAVTVRQQVRDRPGEHGRIVNTEDLPDGPHALGRRFSELPFL